MPTIFLPFHRRPLVRRAFPNSVAQPGIIGAEGTGPPSYRSRPLPISLVVAAARSQSDGSETFATLPYHAYGRPIATGRTPWGVGGWRGAECPWCREAI